MPLSAAAFGPGGIDRGDNPEAARLAIDGTMATGWKTSWYSTAHFGDLKPGTGLLLTMRRRATISRIVITLGPAPGASLEVRVGNAPRLAALHTVASAHGASGTVRLHIVRPASGRYLLIWFTSLPPDGSGTFQAAVYDVTLTGRPDATRPPA